MKLQNIFEFFCFEHFQSSKSKILWMNCQDREMNERTGKEKDRGTDDQKDRLTEGQTNRQAFNTFTNYNGGRLL